jgi:hypothetical protein
MADNSCKTAKWELGGYEGGQFVFFSDMQLPEEAVDGDFSMNGYFHFWDVGSENMALLN